MGDVIFAQAARLLFKKSVAVDQEEVKVKVKPEDEQINEQGPREQKHTLVSEQQPGIAESQTMIPRRQRKRRRTALAISTEK